MAAPQRPPRYTRLSRRLFAEWAQRQSGSKRFAAMGKTSLICPPTMIRGHDHIEVGEDVIVLPGCVLSVVTEHLGRSYTPRLRIGHGVHIGCDAFIACCGLVEIQDRVLTADRVFIGDTFHGYRDASLAISDQPLADPRPVTIETGAFLGIGSAVLPGVTVGEGACVAANAVVTKDVPPRSLAVGNPARIVRRWNGDRWVDVQLPG